MGQAQARVHFAGRIDDECGFTGLAVEIGIFVEGRVAERGFDPLGGRYAVGGFKADALLRRQATVFNRGMIAIAPF